MKKNAFLLLIFLIISKFLGIIRESFLGFYYGSTYITDSYLAASQIPNVIFAFIAAGLVSTFIPIYSQIINREGQERADNYLDNILSLVFVSSLILTAFGLIFTEELVFLLRPGFTGVAFELTVKFLRVTLFAMLSNGVFSIFSGYQQYHDRFLVGPVGGFIMNFIVITSIIVSAKTDPIILAYGLVIASVAQVVMTYSVARFKSGYRFKPGINLKDRYLKPMLIMAMPIIFGSSIGQINNVIDGSFASNLPEGATSILNYSSKISGAIFGLFVSSITTVMYPTIIKQAAKGNIEGMKNTVIKILNTIAIIIIPSSIGLMVLSTPIVDLFYGRGVFAADPESLALTASVLIFASIGLIGQSLKDVMVRAFYSLHDSMTPVLSGIVGVVVNVLFNFLLAPTMGVAGLALATSISALVSFVVLYIGLNRKINGIPISRLFKTFVKVIFASLIMGAIAYFGYAFLSGLSIDYKISMFISIGAAGLAYIVMLYFFKIEEFDELWNMAFSKVKSLAKK